jgi:large subunit ribosomal protein L21
MKYAVIQTGGKQYRIAEGDILSVEHLTGDNKDLLFDKVLLYTADGTTKVGTPYVSGITVKAKLLGDEKGEKIRVSKYKAKVRYRRVTGHRQLLSKIQIESIGTGSAKKEAAPAKVEAEKAPAKRVTKKKA